MKKRDAYHPDYLNMYPCLKERPDILKFLKQCDRKQEYLEYDLKVNRARTNKRTMETVIWPQRELSYEHLLEEHSLNPTEENAYKLLRENPIQRNEYVFQFVRLLTHMEDNCYSVALNGDWGSGKTFFVKQVKLILMLQNIWTSFSTFVFRFQMPTTKDSFEIDWR